MCTDSHSYVPCRNWLSIPPGSQNVTDTFNRPELLRCEGSPAYVMHFFIALHWPHDITFRFLKKTFTKSCYTTCAVGVMVKLLHWHVIIIFDVNFCMCISKGSMIKYMSCGGSGGSSHRTLSGTSIQRLYLFTNYALHLLSVIWMPLTWQ